MLTLENEIKLPVMYGKSAYCNEFASNPGSQYYCLLADTDTGADTDDTVFDLFIAFQMGEVRPEDLRFQVWFQPH